MKHFLIIACLSGLLAVMMGAFGSHGLKSFTEPAMLQVWQTAVHYQMFHSIVLLVLALLGGANPSVWLKRASFWFVVGIIIFSGSLYLLVLSGIKLLGAVTPFGGVSLLVGWLMLVLGAVKDEILGTKDS